MSDKNTSQRLQEAAANCLTTLDAWNKNLKDANARDALLEAVHELRKVTSRLEIDITMNDREAINSKPIPIPEHKSKLERKKQKPLSEILPIAELKEAGQKRKIAIAEAKDNDNSEADSSDTNNGDEKKTTTEKKPRRPRRKKIEDTNNE